MVFHINPETGNPGKCRAQKGQCPFGSADKHYATKEEATKVFEASQEGYLSSAKKTLVLSDIDGTLVRSSLVLESAVEMHESGKIDLGDAPSRWREDMKNEELIRQLAEEYRDALSGQTVGFVKANQTVKRLLASDENFYSTLKELIEHKKNGAEVVLISGSPDFLVRPFAKQFGFKYHASVYHRDRKGRFTGDITLMAGASAKQAVIETLNVHEYDEIIGVGDTSSDSPLLKGAHQSILVDPTEETIESYEKENIAIHKIVRD